MLTPADIAERTQLNEVTIRRLLDKGEIVGHKLAGRWRVAQQDYEDWITANRHAPRDPGVARARIRPTERDPHRAKLRAIRGQMNTEEVA